MIINVFFCDVQAAFGAFYRIEKQPAHLGLLNLRFTRPLVASSDSGIRLAVE